MYFKLLIINKQKQGHKLTTLNFSQFSVYWVIIVTNKDLDNLRRVRFRRGTEITKKKKKKMY